MPFSSVTDKEERGGAAVSDAECLVHHLSFLGSVTQG